MFSIFAVACAGFFFPFSFFFSSYFFVLARYSHELDLTLTRFVCAHTYRHAKRRRHLSSATPLKTQTAHTTPHQHAKQLAKKTLRQQKKTRPRQKSSHPDNHPKDQRQLRKAHKKHTRTYTVAIAIEAALRQPTTPVKPIWKLLSSSGVILQLGMAEWKTLRRRRVSGGERRSRPTNSTRGPNLQ